MSELDLSQPLAFAPIFMERIWGGRRLQSTFGKDLPPHRRIGESWEIVDRPEVQSTVRIGPFHGKTLHELWTHHRADIFGDVPDSARFPLLMKLLDAQDKLSLQVHPPPEIAGKHGGESKTEFWYVAQTDPGAELFVGLREATTRDQFEQALKAGSPMDQVHAIPVQAGDAMFLPAGRFHAIGAGTLLVEVQQNSDTTYRVFDWNRTDETGKPRTLDVEQALQSIDFTDRQPGLIQPKGELLVKHEFFEIQKWRLNAPREITPSGQFAVVYCIEGNLRCGKVEFKAGDFFLLAARSPSRAVEPFKGKASLLRVTVPHQT
jgi:mannose-6-phosphate isomerase